MPMPIASQVYYVQIEDIKNEEEEDVSPEKPGARNGAPQKVSWGMEMLISLMD